MLSDRTIACLMKKGELAIYEPVPEDATMAKGLDDQQFQPASVDLRLGDLCHKDGYPILHFRHETFMLPPLTFILGSTIEVIEVSANIVGEMKGKSTRARQGLIVEVAGLVDPGFRGQITLELFNMSDEPVPLDYGMTIAQICFDWMDTTPERKYGDDGLDSHYQDQRDATPARQ